MCDFEYIWPSYAEPERNSPFITRSSWTCCAARRIVSIIPANALLIFVIPAIFLIRHPDDLANQMRSFSFAKARSRDPDFPLVCRLKAWVPAFAGMTEKENEFSALIIAKMAIKICESNSASQEKTSTVHSILVPANA